MLNGFRGYLQSDGYNVYDINPGRKKNNPGELRDACTQVF